MNEPKAQKSLQRYLLFLAVLLTFEGLARKINVHGVGVLIFFLKDIIVALMGIKVVRMKRPPPIDFLWGAYLALFVLFLPVIFSTALHDPVLAVFGMKQYLLYPFVAFAVFFAFEDATVDEIIHFYRMLALLVVPTTLLAIYQTHLPATSWLNLSVDGGSTEGFSAGGALRVSSSFSFVAQFVAFLNAQMYFSMIALNHLRGQKLFWKAIYLTLIPFLVISSYITGSRGAVVANMIIILIAAGLSLLKFEVRSAFRVGVIMGSMLVSIVVVQFFMPDVFTAYSTRESGRLVGVSSEIQERVYDSLFSWTSGVNTVPFFGNGIGIMSNGSDAFSSYAAGYRSLGIWTETDYATTLFEGGLYLVIVWYGFRFYVIYQTARRYLAYVRGDLSLSGAFAQAFIILIGATETLAIQPPIAIWWWLAVGTSLIFTWKCLEPAKTEGSANPSPPPPPTLRRTPKVTRGRSAYADKLHRR